MMLRKVVKRWWGLLWLLVIPGMVLSLGCQSNKSASMTPGDLHMKKVVAVGFLRALSQTDDTGAFTNPLSGSIVFAEPVPMDIIQKMNDILFEKLAAEKGYELVSRKQAIGAYSSIVVSDENVGMPALKVMQEVGKTFNADAVLAGYIYRWRERVGKNYAAESPASVCFDLQLIRPHDGVIMWKSRFDKTQKSLLENLLDMATFLKGGGKWMKVEDLAMIGLTKMVEEMPSGPGK
jgi:hypothetical protein